jgi:iron complex transport system substrate-binding protein
VRIVSLLPSATEILFAVDAGDDVVGVTFECDFPPEARSRRIVSTSALPSHLDPDHMDPAQIDAEVRARIAAGEDLYHLDKGALRDLAPDLVITQDLCAVCAVKVSTVDAALEHLGCGGNVLTVDPCTLAEVLESITAIGTAAGRADQAQHLVAHLRARLARVAAAVAGRPRRRVVVLEWTSPLFCAGHWVPDMITAAGGTSALGEPGQRSHPVPPRALAQADPDIIVVAPCGYDLGGATRLAAALVEEDILPCGVPVWAVNADAAFVRPGPRLVDGIEALAGICHSDILPARPELASPVTTDAAAPIVNG